jgi:hypothetical protein
MQRVRRPPVRNKINLADPSHVRAWTRRLNVTTDVLRAAVSKVGDSAGTVSKEIELQRSGHQLETLTGTEHKLTAPI